jgi:hypothetical protein
MDLATLCFTYVSPAVTRIHGSTVEETPAQNVSGVLPPESLAMVLKILEEMQREMSRSDRYAYPFSLIMFDVDDFKGVNDRFGHEAGDRVLKKLTEMVRKRIRSTDLLARWGGEDF